MTPENTAAEDKEAFQPADIEKYEKLLAEIKSLSVTKTEGEAPPDSGEAAAALYRELLPLAQTAADKNYAPAILWLAETYAKGVPQISSSPDIARAAELLEEGCRRKIPKVMAVLGEAKLFKKDRWKLPFITRAPEEGLKLLQEAAAAGESEANYMLGMFYYDYDDNPDFKKYKNYEKAFEYLRVATEKKHIWANIELGRRYYWGSGVDKNVYGALGIFRKYAALNYEVGRLETARVLIDAVIPDPRIQNSERQVFENEAFDHLDTLTSQKSAEKWGKKSYNSNLYHRLTGLCYLRGIGTDINEGKAISFLGIAAEGKSKDAETLLKNYYKKRVRHPDTEIGTVIGWEEPKARYGEIVKYCQNFSNKELQQGSRVFLPHMHLVGNDGTGRRTFVQIVASKLVQMGVLDKAEVSEINFVNLSAIRYQSNINQEIKNLFRNWYGGVLVIYTDMMPAKNDETIAEKIFASWLAQLMREEKTLVVMFDNKDRETMRRWSGYEAQLTSLFRHKVEFADYTAADLLEIFKLLAAKMNVKVDEPAMDSLRALISKRMAIGDAKQQNTYLAERLLQDCLRNASALRQDEASPLLITRECLPVEKSHAEDIKALCSRWTLSSAWRRSRNRSSSLWACCRSTKPGAPRRCPRPS